jgi:hypothetical protein
LTMLDTAVATAMLAPHPMPAELYENVYETY